MKKLLASICFAAAVGCATTSFAGALTLDGCSGLLLDDSAVAPTPSAINSPFTYNGTTVGGPTFNRPNANGTSAPVTLSATATAVSYDMLTFPVATAGTYSFVSTSTTAGYDNYTFLYLGSFTGSPLSGVLIGNDNLIAGMTTTSGFTYTLAAGTLYTFLTTGANNASAGTYTNVITLVPEPGTWTLLGMGAIGLGVALRHRTVRV